MTNRLQYNCIVGTTKLFAFGIQIVLTAQQDMTHTYKLPDLLHPKINSVFSSLCRVGVLFAVGLVLLSDGAYAFIGSTSFSRFTAFRRIHAISAEQDAVAQHPLMPSIVKGILFDMDGTLTDSDSLHFEAYRETFLKVCTNNLKHPELHSFSTETKTGAILTCSIVVLGYTTKRC